MTKPLSQEQKNILTSLEQKNKEDIDKYIQKNIELFQKKELLTKDEKSKIESDLISQAGISPEQSKVVVQHLSIVKEQYLMTLKNPSQSQKISESYISINVENGKVNPEVFLISNAISNINSTSSNGDQNKSKNTNY